MVKKYVKGRVYDNFVYPNNDINIYDVELNTTSIPNDYAVSGNVTNFTAVTTNSTGITFDFDYTWVNPNSGAVVINDNNDQMLLSVHLMVPEKQYYKPWTTVAYDYYNIGPQPWTGGITSATGSLTFTVYPSDFGLTSFTNGNYQFEIRMIGRRQVLPICLTYTISSIVGPTPTPTPTSATPTPTPTPSATPSVVAYTSGATLNVTDTGWIKYNMSTGSTYQFINNTGTVTLTNCLDCSTIMAGIPFADVANFTIINCGSSCTPPSPTPTPTPTGSTATLNWSYTEGNGADGYMDLYINGSIVESRSNTSSGTWTVNVGDTINVQVFCDTCGAPNDHSNVYTTGIIVDAACGDNTSASIFTSVYTVVSGDVGTTLTLNTYAICDSGCI